MKIEVILIFCSLLIIGLITFSVSSQSYGYGDCGGQPYGVCEICECYGYEHGYGCEYSDWSSGSCGGSCSSAERQQTRDITYGDTADCTEISRCEPDSSCGYDSGYGDNTGYSYGYSSGYSSDYDSNSGYSSDDYGYSCGYGYSYGYDYGCGYGSYSWFWGYSNYECGYGYGQPEWKYRYRYICGYGYSSENYYTGAAISGFASSEESCYVEPKARGTAVQQKKVGDSSECKMCDGFGGIVPDKSKDGKPCKYIKSGGWFGKDKILDGICKNGECVPPSSCYGFGTFSKTITFTITGNPFDAKNNALYLEKKKEADKDPQRIEFLKCKYPPDYKCPPASAPSGTVCHTDFSAKSDNKVTCTPKNTGQEKECSGIKTGSFEASSGNCYSLSEARAKLLADVNAKMSEKVAEFRADPQIQKTCPAECSVRTESKVTLGEPFIILIYNSINAKVDYKIYCTGKFKGEQEYEISVYASQTKYCVEGEGTNEDEKTLKELSEEG
ncbi:hypothetical protein FJZ19_03155 [Candidatus Pacearchaeota archaeon]|nr:hypothetical protein [Candidatus Pacearchaeota archaeon]